MVTKQDKKININNYWQDWIEEILKFFNILFHKKVD
jgi:hypothetical protein